VNHEAGQKESEAWHHELAEAIPQLVWVWREDGPEYYNRRFIEYTGRTLDIDRQVSWVEWVHPEDRVRAQETFDLAARKGTRTRWRFACAALTGRIDGFSRALGRRWGRAASRSAGSGR